MNNEDAVRIDALLLKVTTSMRLQLSCLVNGTTNGTVSTIDTNRVTTV